MPARSRGTPPPGAAASRSIAVASASQWDERWPACRRLVAFACLVKIRRSSISTTYEHPPGLQTDSRRTPDGLDSVPTPSPLRPHSVPPPPPPPPPPPSPPPPHSHRTSTRYPWAGTSSVPTALRSTGAFVNQSV